MAKAAKKTSKKASNKPTMRELAKSGGAAKKNGLKSRSSSLGNRLKRQKSSSKKTRRIFKLPNNKFGRVLDKLLFTFPRYLKGSWQELRQTTWPNRKETIRLAFAVFVFSAAFAAFVAVLDFALDKIFKNLITK